MAWLSFIRDGLVNAISGLGTTADPRTRTRYGFHPLTQVEIEAAYRGSGLVRKCIDIPADDMTREWRTWQAEADQITALEAEERRLQIRAKVRRAEILRGLGGGAFILGVPGDPSQPAPATIARGGIAYIHVVNRWQISIGRIVDDPAEVLFGGPEYYEISSGGRRVRLHPSRVIPFCADPLPELNGLQASTDAFWGESRVQRIIDPAKHCDTAQAAFAALIQKARYTRVGIPKLFEMLSDDAREQTFIKRFTAIAQMESIANVTLYDSGDGTVGETITDHAVNWTGMPDIMFAFATFLAAVADIPVTRLMGRAAEGMNASGDSQQRDWAKHIKARQDLDLRPCLDALDRFLIPSALGQRPAEVWWEFGALDQETAAEKATRFKTWTEAADRVIMSSLVPERALAEAYQGELIDEGFMSGLEGALAGMSDDERYGLASGDDDGTDPSALTQQQEGGDPTSQAAAGGDGSAPARRAANDAATWLADATPRPLYVQRKLLNAAELIAWARANGFEATLPASDMHVTVLYSRASVDPMKMGRDWREDERGQVTVRPGGPRAIERLGENAVVLRFASPDLEYRHRDLIEAGGSHDWPEYQPHITLSYAVPEGVDLDAIKPFTGALRFGPELFEPLDLDWKSKIAEA